MTPQTAFLSQKIAAEKSVAVLYALRNWAAQDGRWSDELEKQYAEKRKELEARWK